jgi:hypothetical protein
VINITSWPCLGCGTIQTGDRCIICSMPPDPDRPWTLLQRVTLIDPGKVRHELEPITGYQAYLFNQMIRGRAFYRRPLDELREWVRGTYLNGVIHWDK